MKPSNLTYLFAGTALLSLLSTPAFAQSAEDGASAPKDGGDIIVTGSRIPRANVAAANPISVVGAEEIENTGAVNLDSILQRLPASAGFAGNQGNAYWTGRGWGTSQVNLRGLGINRTLTLLNGRRLVSGGTGANTSPDLNMIPTQALERVDVLKDGASAIYGTDAVAGVVNLITKRNFEGLGLAARQGVTERGDGRSTTIDLSLGLRNDRGGISFYATFQDTSPINMASRAPCGLGEVGGALVCVNSASTAGGRAALPNGSQINFNNDPNGNGNFYEPYVASKHNFNGNPYINAVSPIQRISTAMFADYAISDDIDFFAEFLYTHRESKQISTPGTIRNLAISAANPTNPTGQNITLIQRRLAEAGPRVAFQDTNTLQATAGFKGGIAGDWRYEVSAGYGRNTGIDGFTNIANLERVRNSLNPAVCSFATGAAIPCGDYLGANLTPDVLKYILFTSRDTGGNELLTASADIHGSLFELPGGPLGIAAGVTYRQDKGWRDPDPLTVQGIANTNQQDPISGKLVSREAYLEVSAPILADIPFIEELTLNGAVRYSKYDLFGGSWNYKFGGDWLFGEGLRIRGTYGTAFRAPTVPELFAGVVQGNLTTTDPCSNYSTSSNTVLVANCRAAGVPAGYVQLGNSILTNTGGNRNLKPETAKTLTAGIVYEPKFAPGLTLTADYYDIKIRGGIRSLAGSTKLALCYNTPGLALSFCGPSDIARSPITGEVSLLSSQLINVGQENMRGIDFGALYAGRLGSLDASLNMNITYLDKYEITPYESAPPIIYDGRIGGGNGGYPHWRGYGVMTLGKGGFVGTYSVQWIGKAQDFNAAPTQIGYKTKDIFYNNLQLAYEFDNEARIAFGVDNLFDTKAPYIRSYTDGNTDTMTYDLSYRRYYVSVSYKFK
jgi:outer membrane receptor protein involved in Fe transport